MATPIGVIGVYEESEEWVSYSERLEQYFEANDIADGKKVPTLLSVIGAKTYSLLRSLTAPQKPSQKTYAQLVAALKEHLSPKPLVIAERFRFHKRDQHAGETVAEYIAELKRLSEHCNFGNVLNDALRDRLVCGISSETIQRKLLSEEDLTFKKASETAIAIEAASKDAAELQKRAGGKATEVVHKLHAKKQFPRKCSHCGFTNHQSHECYHKNAICRKCKKVGHIKNVCGSQPDDARPPQKFKPRKDFKKDRQRRVHYNECDDNSDETLLASIECESPVNKLSECPKHFGYSLR
jgi:hypothetical protein